MKNITLSASEESIQKARATAESRRTTLNQMFRDWLDQIAESDDRTREHQTFMAEILPKVSVGGRTFSRDEMNER